MRRVWLAVTLVVFVFGVVWFSRGMWRDRLAAWRKPTLPTPTAYVSSTVLTGVSTSVVAEVKPGREQSAIKLPTQVNLAVPFLSQAPKKNWSMPYQEACEEAALIMVDAYFSGRKKAFGPEEGDKAILELVAFEDKQGLAPDLTALQARDLAVRYFAEREARVIFRPKAKEIRSLLARGVPVIVPADGKALKNPNFRGGGPLYHMLVIKGYLEDGRWITNDPGTRNGADYIYDHDILWSAIRDWNGGNVKSAVPAVIIMEP